MYCTILNQCAAVLFTGTAHNILLWSWLVGNMLLNWISPFGVLLCQLTELHRERKLGLNAHNWTTSSSFEAWFHKESGYAHCGFYWKARTEEDQRAWYIIGLCSTRTAFLRLETRFASSIFQHHSPWWVFDMLTPSISLLASNRPATSFENLSVWILSHWSRHYMPSWKRYYEKKPFKDCVRVLQNWLWGQRLPRCQPQNWLHLHDFRDYGMTRQVPW